VTSDFIFFHALSDAGSTQVDEMMAAAQIFLNALSGES